MVCDDDEMTATGLVAAIRAAGHEADTCHHTMDVLRGVAEGQFELVVIGLDMAGFGRSGAAEAMRELAPHVALIALHRNPPEIIHAAALKGVAAVLPRPVCVNAFMRALSRALEQVEQMLEPCSLHAGESEPPFASSL
jgi:DNA-binding NtrC family response regulator